MKGFAAFFDRLIEHVEQLFALSKHRTGRGAAECDQNHPFVRFTKVRSFRGFGRRWPTALRVTGGFGVAAAFERGLMCAILPPKPEYVQEFAVEVAHLPEG